MARSDPVLLPLAVALLTCACASGPRVDPTPEPDPRTWTDLEGRSHRPLDPVEGAVHVLLFLTTDCPVANAYAPEIGALVRDHRDTGARFFLVHVDADTDAAAAQEHAEDYALPGPILLDGEQRLVAATGVTITPEAAVLTAGGALRYRGRIDDWYADLGERRRAPTRRDLRDAIAAVLAGEPVETPRTRPVGCYVPAILD